NARACKRIFKQVAVAVSVEGTRRYLGGVYLAVVGSQLRAVATDGHRLVVADTGIAPSGEWRAVIVASEAGRVMAAIKRWALHNDGKRVRALAGESEFTTLAIDGQFPDYTRVIPAPPGNCFQVEKRELLTVLAKLKDAAPKAKPKDGAPRP